MQVRPSIFFQWVFECLARVFRCECETVRRQTEGFVSGFKLIAIRNEEFGESGTNIIYQIVPENYVPIPSVDFNKGESVFGIQDFDFNCMMKVSFRPSLDSVEGLIPLYDWEI